MAGMALILGPGALYGGYGAGAASVLGRKIKFDRVYGCSVGVYTASFLVTEQFDKMLDVWRDHVHGRLLINPANVIKGRNILDLEYLVGLFQKEPFALDLSRIDQERGRLVYVLTRVDTGVSEYFCPSSGNVFKGMIGSSAVSYVHPEVEINGVLYRDGAFSSSYPIRQALKEGFERVTVVCNFSPNYKLDTLMRFFGWAVEIYEKAVEELTFIDQLSKTKPGIRLLRPNRDMIRHSTDTNKERINQTIDMGMEDAERFLTSWN